MNPNNDKGGETVSDTETPDPAEEHAREVGAEIATDQQQDAAEGQEPPEARQAGYVRIGMAFTDWFNQRLGRMPNAQIRLGTKSAQAVRLHPDGRLKCSLAASAGEAEQTFVAFEGQYPDQLVRKFSAIGL